MIALDHATDAILRYLSYLEQDGGLVERVELLERDRAQFEVDVEGMLLKAEGKLKAANNSEARERTMRNHAERLSDPFSDEVEAELPEGAGFLPISDAPGGPEEGVQPMHMAVEIPDKEHALRLKFL